MNGLFRWSVERVNIACRVLAIGGLGAAGCAGAMPEQSSLTPVQLAQVAEDACAGVPAKLREEGLLAYRSNIANTAPLTEGVAVGHVKFDHARGEQIALRAGPDMTIPWLGRVNNCHVSLARADRVSAAPAADPFVVPGTTVRIEETYTGYLVTIRGDTDEAAGDIVQRTNAMLAAPSGPATAQR
ncbi:MAG TPA: hypothetical protein VGY54_11015 [Polyangiaceae bacterium]|jgi:hypothetical protein|nr:hypothetical protein [Polyangiaceae bacterium]